MIRYSSIVISKNHILKRRTLHVVPLAAGWAVRSEGNRKINLLSISKSYAISYGKEFARGHKSELIIHGRNGRIQRRESYVTDLSSAKNKKHL